MQLRHVTSLSNLCNYYLLDTNRYQQIINMVNERYSI